MASHSCLMYLIVSCFLFVNIAAQPAWNNQAPEANQYSRYPQLVQNNRYGYNTISGQFSGDATQNAQFGHNSVHARSLVQNAGSGVNTVNGQYPGDTTQNVNHGRNEAFAEDPTRNAGGNDAMFGRQLIVGKPNHNVGRGKNLANGQYTSDTTQNVNYGENQAVASNGMNPNPVRFPYPSRNQVQSYVPALKPIIILGPIKLLPPNPNEETAPAVFPVPYYFPASHGQYQRGPQGGVLGSGVPSPKLKQTAGQGSNSLFGVYPGDVNQDVSTGTNLASTGANSLLAGRSSEGRALPNKYDQATIKGDNQITKKQYSGENSEFAQVTNVGSNRLILTRNLSTDSST